MLRVPFVFSESEDLRSATKSATFILFRHAYYLPDGPGNILSLGLLDDDGLTWNKDDRGSY